MKQGGGVGRVSGAIVRGRALDAVDEYEWMERAECGGSGKGVMVDLFVAENAREGTWERDVARMMCARCQVSEECLREALRLGPGARGVWAGTSEKQRRKMRKETGAGEAGGVS